MSMAIAQRGTKVVRCVYQMHDKLPCGVEFMQHLRGQRNCPKHTDRNVYLIGKEAAGRRTNEQGRAEV